MAELPSQQDAPKLDPFAPDILDNPYPVYRRLREGGPVSWHPALQLWLVSGHEACQQVLKDERFGKDFRNVEVPGQASQVHLEEPLPGSIATIANLRGRWFLLQDPPEHTRLRQFVADAFVVRNIEGLAPTIETKLDDLMQRAESKHDIDFMGDIATPLAVSVLFHVLGLEGLDPSLYLRWAHRLVVCADPGAPMEAYEAANVATIELLDELRRHLRVIGKGRAVVGVLLSARKQGHLSEEDLLATLTLLMFGGVDTTANLLGNGLYALLCHPQQWRLLVTQPALAGSTVEELLRWDAPLQLLTRTAMTGVSLAGGQIVAGQWLGLLIGAANRDPQRFSDPDRFDVQRASTAHLAFGRGIHTCIALNVARLEARTVFATMVRCWPNIVLGPGPQRRQTAAFRGFSSLPVVLT